MRYGKEGEEVAGMSNANEAFHGRGKSGRGKHKRGGKRKGRRKGRR